MPQAWTSDNTDAVGRLQIQYGTSLVYPPSSAGAHVSAVPNHTVGRTTPLRTRYEVARTGAFGYELDLTRLTEDEKDQMRRQVAEFKADRALFQFGTFYRLLSPFDGNEAAWMSVSPDRRNAVVTSVRGVGPGELSPARGEAGGPRPGADLLGRRPFGTVVGAGTDGVGSASAGAVGRLRGRDAAPEGGRMTAGAKTGTPTVE